MALILTDTGFWFALYTPTDQFNQHDEAIELADFLDTQTIVLPYPVLYEVLWTGFTRNWQARQAFNQLIYRSNVKWVNDEPYRESAVKITLESARPLSLVDVIIRQMLNDTSLNVEGLITFNRNDFEDVCQIRKITILP